MKEHTDTKRGRKMTDQEKEQVQKACTDKQLQGRQCIQWSRVQSRKGMA